MTEQDRYDHALACLRADSDMYQPVPTLDACRAISVMLEQSDDETISRVSEALLDVMLEHVGTLTDDEREITNELVETLLVVAMRKLVELRNAATFGKQHGLAYVCEVGHV